MKYSYRITEQNVLNKRSQTEEYPLYEIQTQTNLILGNKSQNRGYLWRWVID
jgi:hypothetical protein